MFATNARLNFYVLFAELFLLVNSLLAALFASVLVILQCYLSGSRAAFALPAYLSLGITALLAVFASSTRLERLSRWCLLATGAFIIYVLLRAASSPVPYLARADFYLALAALVAYGLHVLFVTGATERLSIVWLLLLLTG